MTTYNITGMEQLFANLREFPQQVKQKALVAALRKGAAPILDAARSRAAVKTGKLKAAIAMMTDKRPDLAGMDARVIVFVKYKGKAAADYWRFVEFGTSKMPAEPFMRPAFDSQKTNALALILADLSQSIPRIANSMSV